MNDRKIKNARHHYGLMLKLKEKKNCIDQVNESKFNNEMVPKINLI